MTTIWTGSLVATASAGLLAAPKTVYLNAEFTYTVSETEYVDNTGTTQTGTLVQYKMGTGADLMNLIFSDSYITIRDNINVQSVTGTNPLNVVDLDIFNEVGGAYLFTRSFASENIWWFEAASLTETYITVYNSTLDNRTTYVANYTASALQTYINN